MDPENKKNNLMGSNAMEILPNSNFPMIHPAKLDRIQEKLSVDAKESKQTSDSESSDLDLDDEAINMLAEMVLDEEIDDEVSKAD